MLTIGIDEIINQLVKQNLDRKVIKYLNTNSEITAQGLLFEVVCHLTTFDGQSGSMDSSRNIWILYTRNTSVFSITLPKYLPLNKIYTHGGWKNFSNHDSCWREDGTRSILVQNYFEMAQEINVLRKEDGQEPIAPANISQFNHLGKLSSNVFNRVIVTTGSDETDLNGYRKKVIDMELWKDKKVDMLDSMP